MKTKIFNRIGVGKIDIILADGLKRFFGNAIEVDSDIETIKSLNPKWEKKWTLEGDIPINVKSKVSKKSVKKRLPEIKVEKEIIKEDIVSDDDKELDNSGGQVGSPETPSVDLEGMSKSELNDLAAINDVPGVSMYMVKPDMIMVIKEHLDL